jgi:hypothetical protein
VIWITVSAVRAAAPKHWRRRAVFVDRVKKNFEIVIGLM